MRDEIRESLVMQDETDDVSESEADRKQNMMKTLGRLENLGLDESETLECELLTLRSIALTPRQTL